MVAEAAPSCCWLWPPSQAAKNVLKPDEVTQHLTSKVLAVVSQAGRQAVGTHEEWPYYSAPAITIGRS